MCSVNRFDAGRHDAARRGSVGARHASLRRSMVQYTCAHKHDWRLTHVGHSSRSRSCSALRVRPMGRRLRPLICLLFFLFALLVPSVAHAQPSLEISGNPTGMTGNNKGYVVVNTNNEYDAALEVLGLWGTKVQLTSEMFARLSNSDTGGAFYTFASSFYRVGSDGVSYRNYPGWAGDTYYQTLLIDVYGFGNVWAVETNSEDMDAAKRDYNTIRNGGTLGGAGGDSGDVPNYFEVSNVDYFGGRDLTKGYLVSAGQYEPSNVSWRLPVTGVVASRLMTFVTTYDMVVGVVWRNGSYVGPNSGSQMTSTITVNFYGSNDISTSYANNVTVGSGQSFVVTYSISGNLVNSLNVADTWTANSLNNLPNGTTFSVSSRIAYAYWFRGGQIGPPAPPSNNWPDDDPVKPTPEPPEVPNPPSDDTVVGEAPDLPEPVSYPVDNPYTPDPDPPSNPVVTYDPDPTGEPTDYRPWLNQIIKLLRTINTTLDDGFYQLDIWLTEHCDHIRKQIHDEALNLGLKLQAAINNGFVSFERWLQGTYTPWFFDNLEYRLSLQLSELEGYLQELFEWLADELDFSVSGGDYDDSTVVSWLKKIYLQLYQMGNRGASDTQMQLGTIDYDSTYERVSDAYDNLGDNLPFCVPQDMHTIVGWFATSPVTPVFDVPWGFAGDSVSCHVDLSGWDGVAAACRALFMALFCLELTKYTLHLWRLYRAAFMGVSV